jgi:hypothetical protein
MKKTQGSHGRARAGNKVIKCIVRQVLSAHPERYMPWYLRPNGFDEQMFGAK